jgi:diguanylate cyclase (GGDEF)-like protein
MLEARKAAGTAYRDLGQYGSKLQAAVTTRKPDNLVAQLDDGRIVNVSYRPTQNGCWVSTHEDITERAQNEARIAHLAFHDQFTGLPNRAAFNERIANTLQSAAGNASFAVLCVDVDQFKEINDVYGHSTGDRFLVEVGGRLSSACNGSFLARLGADEFIVVSHDGPQPATAQELCAHLAAVLDRPVCIDGYEIESSLTIGASVYPSDGADADTLAANAETALYRAKADHRGSTRFFEPEMGREIREKRALQHDIGTALTKNELELHFQPQALPNGSIFGFEALLRWRHPLRDRGAAGIPRAGRLSGSGLFDRPAGADRALPASGGGSCRRMREHRRRRLNRPVDANRCPIRCKTLQSSRGIQRCLAPRGAIGLSAPPLRPLTRRPAASWRACLSGSGCPFPCR